MKYYAQLNDIGICVGVSTLNEEVDSPQLVEIPTMDTDYINRKHENGKWSTEKYLPDMAAIELTRMEELEQAVAFILGGGLNA